MNPDVPPIALICPALTLVDVTFMFGLAHCGVLKMFVVVNSMRKVGDCGPSLRRNLLCSPKCQRFSPGPSTEPRSAVPKRPIGGAPYAPTSNQRAMVGSSRSGSLS